MKHEHLRTLAWLLRLAVIATLIATSACSDDDDGHSHTHDTGHEHDDTGHGHGDADHAHGDGDVTPDGAASDVEVTEAAEIYCDCMLINCHDPFHAEWGDGDTEAIANCRDEASRWPVAGMATESGDNIECRQHHCDQAAGADDADIDALCQDAIGAACTD